MHPLRVNRESTQPVCIASLYEKISLNLDDKVGKIGFTVLHSSLYAPYFALNAMHYSIPSLLRLATAPVAIAGLLAIGLPIQPVSAKLDDGYKTCAATLRDSGIAEAQVAAACSAALRPADLATCVSEIGGQTAIEASDALSGCRRVRRPLELSTCVVNINPGEGAVATQVLDHCRRSLLPARFSECVVGLVAEIDYNTNRAMKSCIAATDPEQDRLPAAPDGSAPTTETTPPEPITPQVSPNSTPTPLPMTPPLPTNPTPY